MITLAEVFAATTPFPWPQLSAGGLLLGAVSMVLSGWLVPRRVLRDAQEQRDKWEGAWREQASLNRENATQIADLKEIGHTSVALLQSITKEADQRGIH